MRQGDRGTWPRFAIQDVRLRFLISWNRHRDRGRWSAFHVLWVNRRDLIDVRFAACH
jgi:hypothetical protein